MSRNSARLAVAELVVDTIGLMPMGFLWSFMRKNMTAVLQLPGACSSWPCWRKVGLVSYGGIALVSLVTV